MKKTAALGLHVTVEHSDGYFHVNARPVYVGPRPSQLDSRWGNTVLPSADEMQSLGMYDDENFKGLHLDGLKVNSQGNDEGERSLYGFDVRFQDVYTVDLRTAKQMVKTLSTLDKRMDKLENKLGYPATFGGYLLRVASALGATRLVLSKDKGRSGWNRPYVVRDLKTGASEVDSWVAAWVNREPKEGVA